MSDGVGAACLELQDAHELDVNVLLFCLWRGASGCGALTADEMKIATDAVYAWHHDIVRALRAVRTLMKSGMKPAPADLAESLRQRIQKTEIDCEHTEQLMLAAAIETTVDVTRADDLRLVDAVSNVSQYFQLFGAKASAQDRQNIAVMLRVAFRDLGPADITAACDRM